MELLIAYIIIWGILTSVTVTHMPSKMPFMRILVSCSLFPIQWLLLPVTYLYRVLGVGVYFETSILMTEEEVESLSDEIHDKDSNDT